jgi:methyl-accepting chemotaxis protein
MVKTIEEASTNVDEGVSASAHCLEVFNSIAVKASEASDSVSGIAVSSAEQAKGIEEIAKAIAEIDVTTQQNSSLAQEVSALSERLGENASRMNAAVADLDGFVHGQAARRETIATIAQPPEGPLAKPGLSFGAKRAKAA